jgi:hypothetical protein
MAQSEAFKEKSILLLDENSKQMIAPGVLANTKGELGTRHFKKMGFGAFAMLILRFRFELISTTWFKD